jgi:hypothetical protein
MNPVLVHGEKGPVSRYELNSDLIISFEQTESPGKLQCLLDMAQSSSWFPEIQDQKNTKSKK